MTMYAIKSYLGSLFKFGIKSEATKDALRVRKEFRRILKEEAVLAWDERASVCILWQDVQDNAEGAELTRFFESFMDSCDWWLARAVEMNAPPAPFPDIVIRP